MMLPVGLWAFVLGYALVYTGVSYFTGNGGSLALSLGLTSPLQTALPASTPTASSSTSSNLNGGIQTPVAATS
jgi:hypothetical protein